MTNRKTTIAGYLVLVSAVISIVAKFLKGVPVGAEDIALFSTALAGIGLISAKDGGH